MDNRDIRSAPAGRGAARRLAAAVVCGLLALPSAGCVRRDNPVLEGTPSPQSSPASTTGGY